MSHDKGYSLYHMIRSMQWKSNLTKKYLNVMTICHGCKLCTHPKFASTPNAIMFMIMTKKEILKFLI